MTGVHVVAPDGYDDPLRPSGGNVYDRRVSSGLADLGWRVHPHPVPGRWPEPGPAAHDALTRILAGIPPDAVTVVDGLIGSAAPEALVAEAARLRLVLLVHLPLGVTPAGPAVVERERVALGTARCVVATSGWTRDWLTRNLGLPPDRLHVVHPGADHGPTAHAGGAGDRLLCVAAVTEAKGHAVLLAALREIADLPWRCTCAGRLDVSPDFVARLRRDVARAGLEDRIRFPGPMVGADLDAAYAEADLAVLASYAETYGMVVGEALARGLPVVATDVGGVPEALGGLPGDRPGVLVPPGDPAALATALRTWLTEPGGRRRLRAAARERSASVPDWATASRRLALVLRSVATEPVNPARRPPVLPPEQPAGHAPLRARP